MPLSKNLRDLIKSINFTSILQNTKYSLTISRYDEYMVSTRTDQMLIFLHIETQSENPQRTDARGIFVFVGKLGRWFSAV